MSKAAWRELGERRAERERASERGVVASGRSGERRDTGETRCQGEEKEAVEGRERKVDQVGEMEREEGRRRKRDGGRDREESARTHTKRRTVSRGGLGGESEAVGWRRVGW